MADSDDGNPRRYARRRNRRLRRAQAFHRRTLHCGPQKRPRHPRPMAGKKTIEYFVTWAEQPDNSLLVAVEGGQILAVGSVTDAGTIGLNYVSPDARFRGVSRALLHALELRAAERGNTRCTLISTETARRFYLSNGYFETGAQSGAFGTGSGFPMSKPL